MKQSVNFCDFQDAFTAHGRNDNFSYEGKKALFDWLEELADSCGTETELDVIALCCEFSEYASAIDCIKDAGYSFEFDEDDDEEEQEAAALDYLNDNTLVISFDSGIIIQDF